MHDQNVTEPRQMSPISDENLEKKTSEIVPRTAPTQPMQRSSTVSDEAVGESTLFVGLEDEEDFPGYGEKLGGEI